MAIAPNKENECRGTIKRICDTYAVSTMASDVNTIASDFGHGELTNGKSNGHTAYRASWWTQFYAILWRSWLSVLKEPMLVKVRLLQTIVS